VSTPPQSAPPPLLRSSHQLGAHRVGLDVTTEREEGAVLRHGEALGSTLVQVPRATTEVMLVVPPEVGHAHPAQQSPERGVARVARQPGRRSRKRPMHDRPMDLSSLRDPGCEQPGPPAVGSSGVPILSTGSSLKGTTPGRVLARVGRNHNPAQGGHPLSGARRSRRRRPRIVSIRSWTASRTIDRRISGCMRWP
jgi:hypothetical protein